MQAIKCEKLTKFYGAARGIVDVDLSVDEGDFFGFIGPNGAGKSTTIRILLGLINESRGSAKIFDKDIKSSRTELLKNIGYLPSETSFYSGMRVSDVLKLSAKLRGVDCSAEARRLCERLELDTTRKIDELSLGNRKKVGIVCAVQHSPALYVLDEPTSGLDPLMQREFYSILKEKNDEGATVFLSSHVLSEVERYCKHAAVIREGKIIVSDSIANLAHTGIKSVTLQGAVQIPEIDGIKNVKILPDSASFLYSGSAEALVRALGEVSFTDITITDTELEDAFMHYYEGGNDK
ncbi:MAG: ABC transporter ATP-binding protein [Clostridia bacterium]|nr:ABC transporter ATP-binding protein [Clostridia bacterium]